MSATQPENTSSRKCLVTGATGFLGTNLVHELVAQGWDVRASGMHGSETKYLEALPVEVILADITNADEVDQLVAGCDIVFHVAGDTSFWNKFFERQRRINVDGTVNIAQACIKHGVRRLVHTSTLDVLGYHPEGGTYNEITGHYNFNNMGYNYGDTKFEAEQRLKAYDPSQLEIVYIYPGFMIGPYDYTLQIGRVFFDLANGTLPGLLPGGGSYCHVREVAKAHVVAAEKGVAGEGYLCAGMPHSNIPHRDMFRLMAKAINATAPRLTIPRWAFICYGYLCEWLSLFTQQAPDMNPGQARYMSVYQYADSSKAARELDYHVPKVEDCIEDAVSWYRANGFDL